MWFENAGSARLSSLSVARGSPVGRGKVEEVGSFDFRKTDSVLPLVTLWELKEVIIFHCSALQGVSSLEHTEVC